MARPLSLFLLAASMLLSASQVEGHEVADSGWCANPCECRATQARPKAVAGRALVQCMRRGRPIMLEHVIVRGDIDLSGIPLTRMTGGHAPRVVGMSKPRDQLDLDELEREVGTPVDGAVVIRAPIVIRNSSVCGRLLNASRGKDRRAQVPAVFIDSVMLMDSTFHSDVDLSRSRFQRPVRVDRSTFVKGFSFRHSRFNSNAFFSSVISQGTVTLADTRFARDAIFTGMSVQGIADFRKARFDSGAAFDMDGAKKTTLHLADFSEAEFSGAEANFQDAEFRGINFTKARVKTAARFDRSLFMEAEAVSFTQATFESEVVFDDAVFHPMASFFAASFASERPISFDRVTFDRDARWDQARFAGPVTFVGARAAGQLSFVDAELRGTFDVRRSTIEALVIGGRAASARIGGEAPPPCQYDLRHLPPRDQ